MGRTFKIKTKKINQMETPGTSVDAFAL